MPKKNTETLLVEFKALPPEEQQAFMERMTRSMEEERAVAAIPTKSTEKLNVEFLALPVAQHTSHLSPSSTHAARARQ